MMISPSFTSEGTPALAWILTLSPILICPEKPTCPPTIQFLPILVEPEMPVSAAITVFSPISTLCATWIRLSSFTPRLIIVEPMVALSMVVFDPISTSSSMITLPIWATLTYPLLSVGAKPKPSLPMITPECIMHLAPIMVS